jgi:hypothetical protein
MDQQRSTAMNVRTERMMELARQHDAAREWAQELRRRAIAQFWSDLHLAALRAWRKATAIVARRAAAARLRIGGPASVARPPAPFARRA